MNDLGTLQDLLDELKARDSRIKDLELEVVWWQNLEGIRYLPKAQKASLERLVAIAKRRKAEGTYIEQPSDDEIQALKAKPYNTIKELNIPLDTPLTNDEKLETYLAYLADQSARWESGEMKNYCQYKNDGNTPNPFPRQIEYYKREGWK